MNTEFCFLDGHVKFTREQIIERSVAKSEDIVVVSGTLIEGIGNKHSDFDVFVVGPTLPTEVEVGTRNYVALADDGVRQYYDYLVDSQGVGFDVEYYTFEEISEIFSRIEELYLLSQTTTKILRARLPKELDDAVHKIFAGVVIQGEKNFSEKFSLEIHKKLCFVQYRNCTGGYPEFKDVMGSWASKDYDYCLYAMQTYLFNQALGLCHLTGNSSSKQKWIISNVKRLPSHLSRISSEFCRLLEMPRSNMAEKQQMILDSCDLIDSIYAAEARLLDDEPLYYDVAQALALAEVDFGKEAIHDPQTVLEFEHRRHLFGSEGRPLKTFLMEDS